MTEKQDQAAMRFFEEVEKVDEVAGEVFILGHWFPYDHEHKKMEHGYEWVVVNVSGDAPGYMPFCIGLWKEVHAASGSAAKH